MKYEVKVGTDFDPEKKMSLTLEVTAPTEKAEKSNPFSDWKVVAVAATFFLVLLLGGYSVVSGNTVVLDKILDTMVRATSGHPEGNHDGKEKLKDHSSSN